MEQTLGQKRVGVKRDADPQETVSKIKNMSAELIDLMETLRSEGSSGELHRVISLAQTNIETGCMFGVRSCFTK